MPLVPPALSPNAAPAAASTVWTPPSASVAASAASVAACAPRDMPMPWSPSPATASSRPSSSLCSSTVGAEGGHRAPGHLGGGAGLVARLGDRGLLRLRA